MAAGDWTEIEGSDRKGTESVQWRTARRLGACSTAVPGTAAIPAIGDAHPDDSALDTVLQRKVVNVTIDEKTVKGLFLASVTYLGVRAYA